MRRFRLLVIVASVAATAVAVGGSAASAARAPSPSIGTHPIVHMRGRVVGRSAYPAARGVAKYDALLSGSHRRSFVINVWNLTKLKGKHVTVFAGGQRIGRTRVGDRGGAHLARDTARGQIVPNLSPGATITVRHHGGLVASGRFTHVTHILG